MYIEIQSKMLSHNLKQYDVFKVDFCANREFDTPIAWVISLTTGRCEVLISIR